MYRMAISNSTSRLVKYSIRRYAGMTLVWYGIWFKSSTMSESHRLVPFEYLADIAEWSDVIGIMLTHWIDSGVADFIIIQLIALYGSETWNSTQADD